MSLWDAQYFYCFLGYIQPCPTLPEHYIGSAMALATIFAKKQGISGLMYSTGESPALAIRNLSFGPNSTTNQLYDLVELVYNNSPACFH